MKSRLPPPTATASPEMATLRGDGAREAEVGLTPGDERDVGPLLGEAVGGGKADAPARPGDERTTAVQLQVHGGQRRSRSGPGTKTLG